MQPFECLQDQLYFWPRQRKREAFHTLSNQLYGQLTARLYAHRHIWPPVLIRRTEAWSERLTPAGLPF